MKVEQLTEEQLLDCIWEEPPEGIEVLHMGPELYQGRLASARTSRLIVLKGEDGTFGYKVHAYGSYWTEWEHSTTRPDPYEAKEKTMTVWEPVGAGGQS